MSTQVAGVVIRYFLRILFLKLKPSLIHQLEQILGDMNHLKVHPEFRILVLEGVVAMRGRNKDFLHPIIDKGFDVFLGQAFE